MPGRRVLYLSYDGMTDQLGRSQVLPYLTGLSKRGHDITLVSFEKPDCNPDEAKAVRSICRAAGIVWEPLRYHKQPPIISTVVDLIQMRRSAKRYNRLRHFDIVHCRSYIAALVGLAMKRHYGTHFLFDMRGFWADERVDGHIWNLRNPLFKLVYRYFKGREAEFLEEADHVVSLTEEGKRVILRRSDQAERGPPITVIPCCVDFASFPPVDVFRRAEARRILRIAADRRVVAYLGTIGSWYMLPEMLDFFRAQLAREPRALFLFITRDDPETIALAASSKGIAADSLVIRSAKREEVPVFAAAADYGLFFIKPADSKKASSPTKMAEFLALELPIITNTGVGDVAQIVRETGSGVVVENFDDQAYHEALNQLERLREKGFDLSRWRERSRHWFDLATAIARYDAIYRSAVVSRKP